MDIPSGSGVPLQAQVALLARTMDIQQQAVAQTLEALSSGGDSASISAEAMAQLAAAVGP
jgi:hypothetical protein